MENHHHCHVCGNMIGPSKTICEECGKKEASQATQKLSDEKRQIISDALEEWIRKQSDKPYTKTSREELERILKDRTVKRM